MRLPDLQSPLAKAPPWINMQVDKVDVDFQSRHSIMYPSDDGTLSSIRSLYPCGISNQSTRLREKDICVKKLGHDNIFQSI